MILLADLNNFMGGEYLTKLFLDPEWALSQ